MSETRVLRLHRDLYASAAIESAIATYAKHATLARTEEDPHVVLTIASERPGRAEKVMRELANYALGLTIQTQTQAAAVSR